MHRGLGESARHWDFRTRKPSLERPGAPIMLQELAAALVAQQERAAAGAAAGGSKGRGDAEGEREPIYNTDAMHDKLEDIGWTEQVAWEETLALTSTAPTQVANIDDDLERELAFYNQVREGGGLCIASGWCHHIF